MEFTLFYGKQNDNSFSYVVENEHGVHMQFFYVLYTRWHTTIHTYINLVILQGYRDNPKINAIAVVKGVLDGSYDFTLMR